MPTTELHPATVKLLDRMTGAESGLNRFLAGPIDLTEIDALALGDLWTVAKATFWASDHSAQETPAVRTARAILELGRETEPAFRGSACRDYLVQLARWAEERPDDILHGFSWQEVQFVLSRCIDLGFDGLGPAAERCLAVAPWQAGPHLAVVLGRLAGRPAQVLEQFAGDLSRSPLLVAELTILATLDLAAQISLPDILRSQTDAAAPADGDERPRLFDDPGYAAFAEAALTQAAERVRRIHALEVPYAADKAFTLDESPVIARAARLALARDEAWLPPLLDELFRKASLAPTTAKTMPSQSVAIALGHAVEAFPTPEAVAILRQVLRDNRHAGVEKKLQRNLKGAERGLADRPEIALRLPADQPVTKSQLTTLTRCLEAGLVSRMTLSYDDWRLRLASHEQTKPLAASLVWRILDATCVSVLPVKAAGRLVLQDIAGVAVVPSTDSRLTLWHPSDVTAGEREAWRDHLAALRIKQPFKQVFREHYVVPEPELSHAATAMFAGHVVSVVPFLGLARRERWRLDYDCLTRSFGSWTAQFALGGNIFPGFVGTTTTGNLSLRTSSGKPAAPVRLGDLPVGTLSEILRAVDLLVSVSSIAIRDGHEDAYRERHLWNLADVPISDMAEMRKQALQRALKGMPGLSFEARHLRLGAYGIHLTTGRVTHNGEPVTLDLPKSNLVAVPWLPYDEKLLQTICDSAVEISKRI